MHKVKKNLRTPGWLLLVVTLGLVCLTGCDSHGTPAPVANQTKAPLPVRGVQEIDLSHYARIPLEAHQLQVSSLNHPNQGPESLVRPGTEGFWHVKMPKMEECSWIIVDLGQERPVALLRVLPRKGQVKQMWRGHTAELQASNNQQNWATIATLGNIPWPPKEDWISFLVLSSQSYRYYRLSIWDRYFYSMARLELYQLVGYGPPLP